MAASLGGEFQPSRRSSESWNLEVAGVELAPRDPGFRWDDGEGSKPPHHRHGQGRHLRADPFRESGNRFPARKGRQQVW